MTTTITITKRTARNTCFTMVESDRNGGRPRKEAMLHDKFTDWVAKCSDMVVTDATGGEA